MLPENRNANDSDLRDVELARRIGAREPGAFELLMRRYNKLLYRTARSIVRDDSEAEDVLQDAYLQAYRAIGTFRGDARLSTWLTRIVVNEAIARSRKSRRRAEVVQFDGDTQAGTDSMEAVMTAHGSASPEGAAMAAQTRRLLEEAIDTLPDAFRTVFVLRALEEMSGEEVAACLDIPEETVRTRFFRARSALRAALLRKMDVGFEEAFSFDGARCDRIVAAVLARLDQSGSGDA